MKDLTKAEEQIMQILWQLEEAVVKDIIAEIEEPKPAYNTVSTIVRILEKKAFVTHRAVGKTHLYRPLISKEAYREHRTGNLLDGYFENNPGKLVSYFLENEQIDLKEMDDILKLLKSKRHG